MWTHSQARSRSWCPIASAAYADAVRGRFLRGAAARDRSDRQFLAVAVAANAVVVATDSRLGRAGGTDDPGAPRCTNSQSAARLGANPTHAAVSRGSGLLADAKCPSTPYWPWSPTIGRGDDVHTDPERFAGEEIVATEKLDGGNTLLHAGAVYARSVAAPSTGKWMAMVKHHAEGNRARRLPLRRTSTGCTAFGTGRSRSTPRSTPSRCAARRLACRLRRARSVRAAARHSAGAGAVQGALSLDCRAARMARPMRSHPPSGESGKGS